MRYINEVEVKLTNRHLCHCICLISYTNILHSYDYLVSSFIHCYLLFVVFSNKIYALVLHNSKLQNCIKNFVDQNIVKRKYGLKKCKKVKNVNSKYEYHQYGCY